MAHDQERRLSTGGLPPIKVQEHSVVEHVPSHDETPCYTAWVRDEIVQVPQGWSASDFTIANERPRWSFQIYDTTPQAADPGHLKALAEQLYTETRKERDIGGRDQPGRIDVWGMPFAAEASQEERVASCKAHIQAKVAARDTLGDDGFHVSKLRGHYKWNHVILIIDRLEESWDEDEGGFLAVYWDIQPSYLKMFPRAYDGSYREPTTSEVRYTRNEFARLLGTLRSFF